MRLFDVFALELTRQCCRCVSFLRLRLFEGEGTWGRMVKVVFEIEGTVK